MDLLGQNAAIPKWRLYLKITMPSFSSSSSSSIEIDIWESVECISTSRKFINFMGAYREHTPLKFNSILINLVETQNIYGIKWVAHFFSPFVLFNRRDTAKKIWHFHTPTHNNHQFIVIKKDTESEWDRARNRTDFFNIQTRNTCTMCRKYA